MAYQTDLGDRDDAALGSGVELHDTTYHSCKPHITIYPPTPEATDAYKLPLSKRATPRTKRSRRNPADEQGFVVSSALGVNSGSPETCIPTQGCERSDPPPKPEHNRRRKPRRAGGTGDGVGHESLAARMSWAFAELVIDVECLNRPNSVYTNDRRLTGLARSKMIHYGAEMFNHQHRTHAFILHIVHDTARIVYLDRAAAVYSRAFNYVEDPTTLATFLYRFTKMSPEDRGHDPTVSLASKREHILFRKIPKTYPSSAAARENPVPFSMLKRAGANGWPVYAMNIYAQWTDTGSTLRSLPDDLPFISHRCLVGRPHYMSGYLTGKGTRGFVAYDLTEKKVVYIKDSWRAVSRNIHSEYDVYRRLYDRIEPEVLDCTFMYLTVRAGGDVCGPPLESNDAQVNPAIRGQSTCAQEIFEEEGGSTVRPMRRHHRLVFKEVCTPLEDFQSAQDLIGLLYHVIVAHLFAWDTAGLLHRDISASNILIYTDGRGELCGILSDWDLSKTEEQLSSQEATQPSRSGTWQFLSPLRQCYPETPYRLSDDLESFVHVLSWCVLKYLQHTETCPDDATAEAKEAFGQWFSNIYDTEVVVGSTLKFGHTKLAIILSGTPFATILQDSPDNPLDVLLRSLALICKQHYESSEIRAIWAGSTSRLEAKGTAVDGTTTRRAKTGNGKIRHMGQAAVDKKLGLPPPTAETPWSAKAKTSEIITPTAASPLADHRVIIQLFREAFEAPNWPTIQKTADQAPRIFAAEGGLSRRSMGPSSGDSSRGAKGGRKSYARDISGIEDKNGEARRSDIRRSVANELNLRSSSRGSPSRGRPTTGGFQVLSQPIPARSQLSPESRLSVAVDAPAFNSLANPSLDAQPVLPRIPGAAVLPADALSPAADASHSASSRSRRAPIMPEGSSRNKCARADAKSKTKDKSKGNGEGVGKAIQAASPNDDA
ncbi:hypothetical protein C8Q79DRAFT_927309 [Trametes meyenii]|nr:hypothetical protein C8Q79DRAFT_927309 [Trametes meyenii]